MPRVSFTSHLSRHLDAEAGEAGEAGETGETGGASVREVLESVFADNPRLRSYICDEQGALRKHVNIFVAGRPVADREGLTDAVAHSDEIHVMQALSGG